MYYKYILIVIFGFMFSFSVIGFLGLVLLILEFPFHLLLFFIQKHSQVNFVCS